MANYNRSPELESSVLASSEGNKKLIHLSRKVLDCVRRSQQTTGNTIAKDIIKDLPATLSEVDFKNIQRRVYDALNVLHALKIITKVRNEIKYQGGISGQNVEALKLHSNHLRVTVGAKRAILSEKFLHFATLQRLVKRNQDNKAKESNTASKHGANDEPVRQFNTLQAKPLLHVPCVFVRFEGQARIAADETTISVTSDKQFSIVNDVQLFAKLRLHEMSQSELESSFHPDMIRLISGERTEVQSVNGPTFMRSPLKGAGMDYRQLFLQSLPVKEVVF
jgi:hypothetical protein